MFEKEDFLRGEANYFNELAELRRSRGIPCEVDMRTDTVFIPSNIDEELIDAQLKQIVLEPFRGVALNYLFGAPDGIILDVCCGPGWFCLEGARHGREMVGYDISSSALDFANDAYRLKKEKEQFNGTITYMNTNVEEADLMKFKISGVMGWSAFHHLSDPGKFLDQLYDQIEDEGIVVTMDDLESDTLSRYIRYFLKFIFPVYEHSYWEKIRFIIDVVCGSKKLNKSSHSPMEIYSDKHGVAANVIRDRLTNKFVPIYDQEFAAFSVYVCHSLKGPKWWRHNLSKMIVILDRLLVKMKIVRGSYRIIVSKKSLYHYGLDKTRL